ncbi:FUSC family protein [Sphingobacterium hungaricum]|uniref:FUSC family protein n=1 Tax=Sphingobacterium hungaricum TaxID=2082723 RepID=A0A928UY65_9SPHI|nr:FUSC family membrane protein [Sphingobacterium hungaricum]MBE8715411.1 FUSC family protein [Sphingobacterium hungaricum]
MKQTQEISNFFYSQYFADGLRITIGCICPIMVCAALGEFAIGTNISLGALLVGLSDTPGAPTHRRVGMLSCALFCIFTHIVTISFNSNFVLMAIVIGILSFFYSMFAVFNARAATVGSMCILMMLLNVDNIYTFKEELYFLLFFIIGASWYMFISMSITQARPYRLAQQELSESIRHVADFIRLKASFYQINQDYEANYLKIIEKQIAVNEHQENVRDLLFQSKRAIKDTTNIGRFLTLVFADIVDLYEQSLTTHYDYNSIRETYGHTGVLSKFNFILIKMSGELDHLAYKLNANKYPKPLYDFSQDIEDLKIATSQVEKEYGLNTMPLKKVIVNIRDMLNLINNIYNYSQLKSTEVLKEEINESSKFVRKDKINWQKLKDNLSLNSSVFRHALRMSIALSGTFVLMYYLPYGEMGSFWVLLTILVILKPGFGLTKERNLQRLLGTLIGGVVGAIILLTIHDEILRFGLMLFFFLTAYSLFRVNYIVAVVFMTPYVLIMLSFTGINTFDVAQERIIDTFIGGAIAFLSSYIIFPNWESFQIKDNMRALLIANYNYFGQSFKMLSDAVIPVTQYKLARKEVYITSANMASTFQRLLTEPKWRQKSTKEVNRFVILNHIFSSYSATLLTQLNMTKTENLTNEHVKTLKKTLGTMEKTIESIEVENPKEIDNIDANSCVDLGISDSEESKLITDQLQFLNKISSDLQKTTSEILFKEDLKIT